MSNHRLIVLFLLSLPFAFKPSFAEDRPLQNVPLTEVIQKAQSDNLEYKDELAVRLFEGHGVPKDPDKSLELLNEDAQTGRPESQYLLANVLLEINTEDNKPDYESAAIWCRKAADQGYLKAQTMLGQMYWSATGLAQDYRQARKLLTAAAGKGDGQAEGYLGYMNLRGNGCERNCELGMSQLHQGAKTSPEAQRLLGFVYQQGYCGPVDDVESVKWYQRSYAQKDFVAAYNLGLHYLEGTGVPKDEVKGAKLIQEAAHHGLHGAQWKLGKLYEKGIGVEYNPALAVKWAQEAAKSLFVKVNFNPEVK